MLHALGAEQGIAKYGNRIRQSTLWRVNVYRSGYEQLIGMRELLFSDNGLTKLIDFVGPCLFIYNACSPGLTSG